MGFYCEGCREPERGFKKSEGNAIRFTLEKALRWQSDAWIRRKDAQWFSYLAVHSPGKL